MELVNKKIQMASHSGAGIEVVNQDGEVSVVKTVVDNLDRALIAAEKQRQFENIWTPSFDITSIPLTFESYPKSVVMKMPYVDGLSGETIAVQGNKATAEKIKIALNSYLIAIFSCSEEQVISRSVFLDKVSEIKEKPLPESVIDCVDRACLWLEENCPETLNIPVGKCHGDLTMSNIILSSNELYLFDFLDSFVETPLQDVSKLIQDMKYGWSFRNESSSIRLKGMLFLSSAFPDFINTLSRVYEVEISILNIITVLRIAPYISSNDDRTVEWLNQTLNRMLEN